MDPCFTSHILETCVEIRSIGGEVCTKTGDGFNTKIDQYIRSWQWRWENALCPDLMKKKPRRSTCTMINESGKAKKVRNLCCKGCKIQEKWPFLGTFFSWSEGHETLKGLSFLSACWCAYTRDSAPGGMYMYMYIQLFATGVGKCSFLGIFSITFKCSLEIVFPIVGWC